MNTLDKDILKVNIESSIKNDMLSGKIAGAAAYVVQDDKEMCRNFLGYSDPVTNEPLTEKNLFRMASMTKPVTTVCILILAERNLLKISDPVSKYIPGFKNFNVGYLNGDKLYCGEAARQEITVEMILSHKSGIGSGRISDMQMMNMQKNEKTSLETAVNFYKNMLLDFQPGEHDCYSPVVGFDILARIVEIVSNMPFADFVMENIFIPLKMNDTTFVPNDGQWDRIVKMTDFSEGKPICVPMHKCVFSDFSTTYTCGGAGMVSSLDDYMKFACMLMHKGTFDGVEILSPKSVENMYTPNLPSDTVHLSEIWGLGVRVNKDRFYERLPEGAFGWSGAYGTHFFVDVKNKIAAVYMKNSMFDGGSGATTAANFENDVYRSEKKYM